MTFDEYLAHERQIYTAADRDEALRLSAELLANVDQALRLKVNAREERVDQARAFARAAALHLDILSAHGGEHAADVYSTALTALLMLDMADSDSEPVRLPEVFQLTALALSAFNDLTAMMPQDEFTTTHVPVLYTLWGSRLYYYYQVCDKTQVPLRHLVEAAHSILEQLIEHNIVKWPDVEVDGQTVPVQSNVVLADIIGRSIALGIFRAG